MDHSRKSIGTSKERISLLSFPGRLDRRQHGKVKEMQKRTDEKATVALASHVYKTARMGADSITDVLPKVQPKGEQNTALRETLTSQFGQYEKIASKAETFLSGMNEIPKEENLFTKATAKMGIAMNTLLDATPSHIAEMMIEGLTMGITDSTKQAREGKTHHADEKAMDLCHELISFQEQSVDKLKSFL